MAGLLAWAADVVGGTGTGTGGGIIEEQSSLDSIPILFSEDQKNYVRELDSKSNSLQRSIHDLRLRLPPPDISQRLPHLHAHSLASNNALALQLNSHSSTRHQAQLREETLREENAAFENAISNCENKIKERLQEAELLQSKLEEMDETETKLRDELENMQLRASSQSWKSEGWEEENKTNTKAGFDAETEVLKTTMLEKLDEKKKELSLMEDTVKELEKKWAAVQENALKLPSPVQREKTLDKQLHGLLEQLAVKQAQAEGLLGEIHPKEMELERLNAQWRQLQNNNSEANNARNRFVKGSSDKLHGLSDYDGHQRLPYHSAGRTESQQRLMLLRSAFVLYILALNVIVFIRISF